MAPPPADADAPPPPKNLHNNNSIEIPLLPARGARVLLPGVVVRMHVARTDAAALLDRLARRPAPRESVIVGSVPLRPQPADPASNVPLKPSSSSLPSRPNRAFDPEIGDNPFNSITRKDLFGWGCLARFIDLSRASSSDKKGPNATYIITLEGVARFHIQDIIHTTPYIQASVEVFAEQDDDKQDTELQALVISLRAAGNELTQALMQLQLPPQVIAQLREMLNSTPPGQLADLFASMIDLSIEEKLRILETVDLKTRIRDVINLMTRQIQVLKISQKLQTTVENKLGQKQREFLLREQLEAIKKELGQMDDGGGGNDEIQDLARRIEDAKLPEEARKATLREMKRLKRMSPSMAEYQVIHTYLELVTELPWSKSTPDNMDIVNAQTVLDNDHYGLDRVKTRVIEYLAVRKLKKDLRGPILCFAGPPGVGKTSLGRSIANALGRKFHRISLGGVRDEAEIRGHRRTYIGAMPGLIIQGLRRCGVNNPVFLLDEIDKLGRDFRGDPSAALLEVLDPEQNSTFSDHYLNIPFDLTNVIFIATANDLENVPDALLDRMEVIHIPGYTIDEKIKIAQRYLVPKQITSHGLRAEDVQLSQETLMKIVTGYTREAGVRSVEREIAAVCRWLAVEYSRAKERGRDALFDGNVPPGKLETVLGPERYDDEVAERTAIPGVVTGLAWTSTGTGGLLFIEATQTPGNGELRLTGKLGDVIKESAQIAMTWVRANAQQLGLEVSEKHSGLGDTRSDLVQSDGDDGGVGKRAGRDGTRPRHVFEDKDVHIHFPAGATPKDGPSAGVTIVTALVSMLRGVAIREHTAMTGEITLRGQVLPVGGIKEKVIAAHRGGVVRVVLPARNAKDIVEVPVHVRDKMEFVFAKSVWEVLAAAFGGHLKLNSHPQKHQMHQPPQSQLQPQALARL